MHTDLTPHLHTDKCNEMVEIWRQCRRDHPLRLLVGYCNSDYNGMLACLKGERLTRRAENARTSAEAKKKTIERIRLLEQERKQQEASS